MATIGRVDLKTVAAPYLHKVFTAVVVGSVGAGKSSLVGPLVKRVQEQSEQGGSACEGVRVVVVREPVDVWGQSGAFQNFFRSPQLYAATFQHEVLNTRIQVWVDAWWTQVLPAIQDPAVSLVLVVLERSPLCDKMLFAQQMRDDGTFTAEQYALYEAWFAELQRIVPSPIDLYIDVNTPFDETLRRIEKRANEDSTRAAEKNYDLGYLRQSFDRQRRLLDTGAYGSTSVLHVDGRLPFHTDSAVLDGILERVHRAARRASLHRSGEHRGEAGEGEAAAVAGVDEAGGGVRAGAGMETKAAVMSPLALTPPLPADFPDYVRRECCQCEAQCIPAAVQ